MIRQAAEISATLLEKLWGWQVIRTRAITHGGHWGYALWMYPPGETDCHEHLWWDDGGYRASWPLHSSYPAFFTWKGMAELHERLTAIPYLKIRLSSSFYHGDFCEITAPDETQMPEGLPLHDARAVWATSPPVALALAACEAVGCPVSEDDRDALFEALTK